MHIKYNIAYSIMTFSEEKFQPLFSTHFYFWHEILTFNHNNHHTSMEDLGVLDNLEESNLDVGVLLDESNTLLLWGALDVFDDLEESSLGSLDCLEESRLEVILILEDLEDSSLNALDCLEESNLGVLLLLDDLDESGLDILLLLDDLAESNLTDLSFFCFNLSAGSILGF